MDTLEIDFAIRSVGVVTLRYSVFAQWDVIARSAEIFNRGTGVPIGAGPFTAAWTSQFPQAGTFSLSTAATWASAIWSGCRCGTEISGRQHARGIQPALQSICDFVRFRRHGNGGKLLGIFIGVQREFYSAGRSGSDRHAALCHGIAPQNFSWELKPGASFQAPEVLLCFSDYGFDALSNRLNGFQMQHLVRGKYRTERCPILVNNWEATYFDFDE